MSVSLFSSRATSIIPYFVRMHVPRCVLGSSLNSESSLGKYVLTNVQVTDRSFGKQADTEFCKYLEDDNVSLVINELLLFLAIPWATTTTHFHMYRSTQPTPIFTGIFRMGSASVITPFRIFAGMLPNRGIFDTK